MLAPGYLARAYIDRSKHFAVLGVVLALCALLQLAVLMRYGIGGRSFTLDPRILTLPMLLQTIFVPLFGVDWVGETVRGAAGRRTRVVRVHIPRGIVVDAVRGRHRMAGAAHARSFFIVAGLWVLVSVINTFGSLGSPLELISGKGGSRYFLFGAMCFCLLLAIGTTARSRVLEASLRPLFLWRSSAHRSRSSAAPGPPSTPKARRGKNRLAKCAPSVPCEVAIWPNGWSVRAHQSAR